jgi:Tol biopolymer transport system component
MRSLRCWDDPEGPKPFIQGRFNADDPQFSPDGRYLAYSSDESGRVEIYVRPHPGPGGITQISNQGGNSPLWSRDGRELFYMNNGKLMAVAVHTQPELMVDTPVVLFQGTFSDDIGSEYDIASDGKHFVMVRPPESAPSPQVLVILNYFSELKRLAPSGM